MYQYPYDAINETVELLFSRLHHILQEATIVSKRL